MKTWYIDVEGAMINDDFKIYTYEFNHKSLNRNSSLLLYCSRFADSDYYRDSKLYNECIN